MTNDQFREGDLARHLPSSAGEHIAPQETVVVCPRCCASTDSLKCQYALNVIFLFVYVVWNTEKVVACPECMRGILFKRMLLSIPLANFLFPVVALIYLGQIIVSRSKGHTDIVLANEYRMTRDEQIDQFEQTAPREESRRRDLLVFGLILLLIALIWGGGAWLRDAKKPVEQNPQFPVWEMPK